MAKLVRIKRHDPRRGHVLRRYTAFAITFEEARGWYRVPDEIAAYLAGVHQVPDDEETPLAFDVCTEDEAARLEAAEKKKAEERARAAEPNVASPRTVDAPDLSTADLKDPARRAARPGGPARGA